MNLPLIATAVILGFAATAALIAALLLLLKARVTLSRARTARSEHRLADAMRSRGYTEAAITATIADIHAMCDDVAAVIATQAAQS